MQDDQLREGADTGGAKVEVGSPFRPGEGEAAEAETVEALRAELNETKDKYVRLYAEFDNYRKKVAKDKEELVRYSNESLMFELLPFIDNLEMCLRHSAEAPVQGTQALVQGVENTVRELKRTLDKFGLTAIDAIGKPFDPAYHHAMSQVERADVEANTVVEEFRKGYLFREKVLRPSFVAVSKQPSQ